MIIILLLNLLNDFFFLSGLTVFFFFNPPCHLTCHSPSCWLCRFPSSFLSVAALIAWVLASLDKVGQLFECQARPLPSPETHLTLLPSSTFLMSPTLWRRRSVGFHNGGIHDAFLQYAFMRLPLRDSRRLPDAWHKALFAFFWRPSVLCSQVTLGQR